VVALAVVSGSLRHGGNGWEEIRVQQLQKDRNMRLVCGRSAVCGVLLFYCAAAAGDCVQ